MDEFTTLTVEQIKEKLLGRTITNVNIEKDWDGIYCIELDVVDANGSGFIISISPVHNYSSDSTTLECDQIGFSTMEKNNN